ncbi:M23 family metallopeptidase [Saccharopolyspora cebuensis]|uniref:M23 family metallopeptidase n=1 Tax=Saccharopolyspora cebuensis TaxID=418759 RepID=A0ABV4CUN5_9PSEU
MSDHRQENEQSPNADLPKSRKLPVRNKVVAAVVATGAFAAVGVPFTATAAEGEHRPVQPLVGETDLSLAVNGAENRPASVELLQARSPITEEGELGKIEKARELEQQRAAEAKRQAEEAARKAAEEAKARAAAEAQAAREKAEEEARKAAGFVKPAEGTFTSGFGARWGSSHNGIDIANDIGTPIRSVAAGEVINAGPASGFGQWIRVQHDDGTISVYGHINTIDASVGDRVDAGEQIATMGNRGQSTGPHLHFEIITGGSKINPLPWLQERGIDVQS